jgi:AcrR family transcriptional regulator
MPSAGRRLTERRIAEAALALVDREGVEGLSMRKLAQSLGVSTMALYTYFPDKETLLDAVTQLVLAEIEAPTEDLGWRETIRRIMRSARAAGLRHPHVAPLIARYPPRTPDALAFVEAGFRSFQRAGFDDHSTARCYRALAVYSMGSFDVELNDYFTRHPAATPDAIEDVSMDRVLPHVGRIGPMLAGQDDREEFEYGLDLMLDGFAGAMAGR